MKEQGVYDLNEKQQKLFDELKTLYKKCEKSGIFFVNNYGCLYGYDKAMIKGYSEAMEFPEDETIVDSENGCCINSTDSYADGTHYIHLTKKGIKRAKEEGLL